MKHLITVALVIAGSLPSTLAAAEADGPIQKTARRGDVASSYLLNEDGGLFRRVGRNLCQVTTEVDDLKIAAHPGDPTLAYFVRGGGLHALTVAPGDRADGACPRANVQTLVPALDRDHGTWSYRVVPRADTSISLVAMDTSGHVTAWDDRGVAVSVDNVTEFKLNACFGSKQSFNSYVAFAIDDTGVVSKIGGKDPRRSKADPKRYRSLKQFLSTNRVCQ